MVPIHYAIHIVRGEDKLVYKEILVLIHIQSTEILHLISFNHDLIVNGNTPVTIRSSIPLSPPIFHQVLCGKTSPHPKRWPVQPKVPAMAILKTYALCSLKSV